MTNGGGLDPRSINPPDAIAALRSFPRRWRSALAFVADEPSAAELVRRRTGDSWSALDHTWYAVELLESTDERIRMTQREDRPTLADAVPSGPPRPRGELEGALAAIGRYAPALAETLENLPPDHWRRGAFLDDGEVTILSLAQGSVADVASHLRAAEKALRTARGAR